MGTITMSVSKQRVGAIIYFTFTLFCCYKNVCCQDAGGLVSGGSTSDSASGISGVSAFSGGSGSSSSDSYGGGGYIGDNIGVNMEWNGIQFYLHPFLRDILSFITGGGQRTRTQGGGCPPTSPCRLRGGKCCPLVQTRRRRVCP